MQGSLSLAQMLTLWRSRITGKSKSKLYGIKASKDDPLSLTSSAISVETKGANQPALEPHFRCGEQKPEQNGGVVVKYVSNSTPDGLTFHCWSFQRVSEVPHPGRQASSWGHQHHDPFLCQHPVRQEVLGCIPFGRTWWAWYYPSPEHALCWDIWIAYRVQHFSNIYLK